MAAPRASRDQTNCLHICVPGSSTAKTHCTFEQQTMTCEETHARNADTTQTAGTHDTTDSRAPKNVTSVRTLQQRTYRRTEGIVRYVQEGPCSMTTNDSHVIGSDAQLSDNIQKQKKTQTTHTHHEYRLVATRQCLRNCATVSHEGPSDGHLRPEFGPYLTCVDARKMH